MDTVQQKLGLSHGRWLALNCGNVPDSKCHLVIMAPDAEKSELLEAAMSHVTERHAHEDTPELREKISQSLGSMTL